MREYAKGHSWKMVKENCVGVRSRRVINQIRVLKPRIHVVNNLIIGIRVSCSVKALMEQRRLVAAAPRSLPVALFCAQTMAPQLLWGRAGTHHGVCFSAPIPTHP